MRNHVSYSVARLFVTGAMAVGVAISGADASFAEEVVIGEGDTLSKIARDVLGDGYRWTEICEANKDVLGENCDIVIPGMVLNIPESPNMAGDDAGTGNAEAGAPVYEYAASLTGGDVFNAPAGYSVNQLQEGGIVEMSGAGGGEVPSYGRPGVWMQLPAEFEQAASGKTVKMTITASLSSPGDVAFSYSTNEVGNSGWRRLTLDETAKEVSFTYDVPALNKGGGDFLGVWPDPTGTGQVLRISGLKAEVF